MVAHTFSLRRQILTVVRPHASNERGSGCDIDAVYGELSHLFWIVGQEVHLLHPEFPQHFSRYGVVSSIGRMTKHEVGIEGIGALVLKVVSLYFRMEADASPFLTEVEEHAPAPFDDGVEGRVQLRPAIAPGAGEHITGQALGVEANDCLLYTSPSPRDR